MTTTSAQTVILANVTDTQSVLTYGIPLVLAVAVALAAFGYIWRLLHRRVTGRKI